MMLGLYFVCLACQTEQIDNTDKNLLERSSQSTDSCETSFAIGNADNEYACFSEGGFNRWGWSIGPISEGTYTYDVYAGAGQCITDNGVLAGTVTIEYSNGLVSAEYDFLDGYTTSETHLYAGSTMYPTKNNGRNTVAPGQYYIEANLSGDIYVIAHAVTCYDDDSNTGAF